MVLWNFRKFQDLDGRWSIKLKAEALVESLSTEWSDPQVTFPLTQLGCHFSEYEVQRGRVVVVMKLRAENERNLMKTHTWNCRTPSLPLFPSELPEIPCTVIIIGRGSDEASLEEFGVPPNTRTSL